MQNRLIWTLPVLACWALVVVGLPGCGESADENGRAAMVPPVDADGDSDVGVDNALDAAPETDEVDVPEPPADEPEVVEVEPEPEAEVSGEVEAPAATERDSPKPTEVNEDIARRHIGAWIGSGRRHQNSLFIFTEDGRAQVGTDVMMLSGDYTIDYDKEMSFLHITIDVMGRAVEQKFFMEFLPDDRIRLYTANEDPDAPGEYERGSAAEALLLERDE